MTGIALAKMAANKMTSRNSTMRIKGITSTLEVSDALSNSLQILDGCWGVGYI